MKRAHFLLHLSFPVAAALIGLVMSLRREPISVELLFVHLNWGLLFYAAPHSLWAIVSNSFKPVLAVWHAGFFASSGALLLTAALSVWGPGDQSGRPFQWLLYWPLSAVFLVVVVIGWFLKGRQHAST
jgi:hypothetical protein